MAAGRLSKQEMPPKSTKIINLALQGGGAHGAFTWGVLDRMLEEEGLIIEGISGTSAGAINGAILISGYIKNGPEGAKKHMEEFWRRVSDAAAWSPLHKNSVDEMLTGWNLNSSPAYRWYEMMSQVFSPYVLNPLNLNPMRNILEDMINTKAMAKHKEMKLFVTATHIASGQAHVFQGQEITTEALLASSCMPLLFQAVEVDGEYYWDGGYLGNPAIWPLIYKCKSKDVVLVQINPIHSDTLPKKADEIIDRLNEITFNSSLIAEMRAIDFVARLIKKGSLKKSEYKDMRMHLIYAANEMQKLNASSKMNADWDFFLFLKEIGRTCADNWLKHEWKNIGLRSTVNIREKFLSGVEHKKPKGVLKKRASQNE
jgi:NTE family protein